MEQQWRLTDELERYTQFLNDRPPSVKSSSREMWDTRADSWEKGLRSDEARQKRSGRRIAATAEFLRAHGLLGPDSDVIDIGCGPGRFVAEFARTANHATGTDISQRMLEHAAAFASSQGIGNATFLTCDFKAADIDALGWRRRFDLVFTSLTPAVSRTEDFDKAMAMSRGWCFNSSFVNVHDGLLADIAKNVFHKDPPGRWDGRLSYALFNILWLRGFCPYVTYYSEKSDDTAEAGRPLAEELAAKLGFGGADAPERIYRYIMERADGGGTLTFPYSSTYAWLLWDVREQISRAGYEQ